MCKYLIKVRLGGNCFKNYCINLDRYLTPILNVLKKCYSSNNITVEKEVKNE